MPFMASLEHAEWKAQLEELACRPVAERKFSFEVTARQLKDLDANWTGRESLKINVVVNKDGSIGCAEAGCPAPKFGSHANCRSQYNAAKHVIWHAKCHPLGSAAHAAAAAADLPETPKGQNKRVAEVSKSNTPTKSPKKAATDASDANADVFTRLKSFAVDDFIEAQDEENLWYPAHIIDMEARQVLVSFDGWGERWDEWIPKTSLRLREHRGWGTPAMPKDWQQDSTIEALDMEGKWYKAKVLHVSEIACKVHYSRWASKWDEWVGKTSGRLRRLDDKGLRLKLDGARGETHDDVCALCEEPGEVICCGGRCQRVFHRACIPPTNPPPPEDAVDGERWVCSDCLMHRYRCFYCKMWGAERFEVHTCGRKGCGKPYHVECLLASLEAFPGSTLPPFPPPVSLADKSASYKNACVPCVKPSSSVAPPEAEVAEMVVEDDDEEDAEEGEESVGDREDARYLDHGHEWIGKRVRRYFDGVGHDGRIVSWLPDNGSDSALWHMEHDDGDSEDLDAVEVRDALRAFAIEAFPKLHKPSVDGPAGGAQGGDNDDGSMQRASEPPPVTAQPTTTLSKWRKPRRTGRPAAWVGVTCARHWCIVCLGPESSAYGKAMSVCVRCPKAVHRSCMGAVTHTALTSRTFLCTRCEHHTPKGLCAPDPFLPPEKRLARNRRDDVELAAAPPLDDFGNDKLSTMSLVPFGETKLGLKGFAEFTQPNEILHALDNHEVLPNGTFQPPAYAQLRRSVYLHSEGREKLEADQVMVCSCSAGRGGCDDDCHNAAMQHECNPSTCPMGPMCTNRHFSMLPPAKDLPLQLFKTRQKGWGVMATRSVLEGELVIEYVGEVIGLDSWESRKKSLTRFDHFYFMALNGGEIVDASRKGNIARFINHSCSPNLVVEKWYVNRVPRLGLWARRDIAGGEELTYNYSVKWTGDADHAQSCHCGAENCTGFLGRAPKR